MERKSLQLTAEQWEHLQDLAGTHEALSRGGPTTGQPTWRVLVRMIADGELLLLTREALAEGMKAIEGIKTLAAEAETVAVRRVVYKSPP